MKRRYNDMDYMIEMKLFYVCLTQILIKNFVYNLINKKIFYTNFYFLF